MDLSFASSELADLCNCEAALAGRWGAETARFIGRRLFDLAASTAATLSQIPGATLVAVAGTEETVVAFANGILIRGVITPSNGDRGTQATAGHILIVSVDVHGSDHP